MPIPLQEIVSYIKGSRQAVEGGGMLTEEEYLADIGRKQASLAWCCAAAAAAAAPNCLATGSVVLPVY